MKAKAPKHYFASLPERSVRALAALGGGLIQETSAVLLPVSVRGSRLYQATVARLLRIVVELVGDVQGVYPSGGLPVRELMIRKTAGNTIEIASFLAVGWSPIWLLAAVSDIIGGSRAYLSALVDELKTAKLLPAEINVTSFDELLTALENTSGTLADTLDVLPTSARDLRTAWEQLRTNTSELPDAGRLATLFGDLQTVATREQRSLLQISSIVALGAVRAGLQLGTVHLFDYYRKALDSISREGLVLFLRRVSAPYIVGAVAHFDNQRPTFTQRMLDSWDSWRTRRRRDSNRL